MPTLTTTTASTATATAATETTTMVMKKYIHLDEDCWRLVVWHLRHYPSALERLSQVSRMFMTMAIPTLYRTIFRPTASTTTTRTSVGAERATTWTMTRTGGACDVQYWSTAKTRKLSQLLITSSGFLEQHRQQEKQKKKAEEERQQRKTAADQILEANNAKDNNITTATTTANTATMVNKNDASDTVDQQLLPIDYYSFTQQLPFPLINYSTTAYSSTADQLTRNKRHMFLAEMYVFHAPKITTLELDLLWIHVVLPYADQFSQLRFLHATMERSTSRSAAGTVEAYSEFQHFVRAHIAAFPGLLEKAESYREDVELMLLLEEQRQHRWLNDVNTRSDVPFPLKLSYSALQSAMLDPPVLRSIRRLDLTGANNLSHHARYYQVLEDCRQLEYLQMGLGSNTGVSVGTGLFTWAKLEWDALEKRRVLQARYRPQSANITPTTATTLAATETPAAVTTTSTTGTSTDLLATASTTAAALTPTATPTPAPVPVTPTWDPPSAPHVSATMRRLATKPLPTHLVPLRQFKMENPYILVIAEVFYGFRDSIQEVEGRTCDTMRMSPGNLTWNWDLPHLTKLVLSRCTMDHWCLNQCPNLQHLELEDVHRKEIISVSSSTEPRWKPMKSLQVLSLKGGHSLYAMDYEGLKDLKDLRELTIMWSTGTRRERHEMKQRVERINTDQSWGPFKKIHTATIGALGRWTHKLLSKEMMPNVRKVCLMGEVLTPSSWIWKDETKRDARIEILEVRFMKVAKAGQQMEFFKLVADPISKKSVVQTMAAAKAEEVEVEDSTTTTTTTTTAVAITTENPGQEMEANGTLAASENTGSGMEPIESLVSAMNLSETGVQELTSSTTESTITTLSIAAATTEEPTSLVLANEEMRSTANNESMENKNQSNTNGDDNINSDIFLDDENEGDENNDPPEYNYPRLRRVYFYEAGTTSTAALNSDLVEVLVKIMRRPGMQELRVNWPLASFPKNMLVPLTAEDFGTLPREMNLDDQYLDQLPFCVLTLYRYGADTHYRLKEQA